MIISSKIINNTSQGDGRNYVIEEHIFDDGSFMRVEGLRDGKVDFESEMLSRIPMLENQKADEIATKERQVLRESADTKINNYIKVLDSTNLLKSYANLTDEELNILKQNG